MRVVVTGGAGFIGSHLCDQLINLGYEVVCVDNFITGSPAHTDALLQRAKGRFTLYRHNISEHVKIDRPVDGIFHLASPASPNDYLQFPIQTLKVGSLGTHNALGLAMAKKARFLLASTSEVYGDPKIHPQKESYWGNVNPIGPRGVYDEAKRFAEAITMAYHRAHGVNVHIVRIFNTYGPRMRIADGRAVPAFLSQALRGDPLTVYGDGSQTRSFCYVSDLVEGLIRLMGSEFHEPVNLGNPHEITILELAQRIKELTGSSSPIVHKPLPVDDPLVRKPDIARARELLGWEPKVPFEEGIRLTAEDFRRRIFSEASSR
ncbi:MAG: SDR family oxidoreductase [Candidatus Tectomicrobia bacterium]|nr:SDR family oxidoreductase [Candidatus Tectomicrobia bacterium]